MAGFREPEKYPAYKRPQRNPSKMLWLLDQQIIKS